MAPLTSEENPVPSTAYSDTVVMKDPDSPWAMDLNTSVTIVLGVLSLILQAWQICYGPRHMSVNSTGRLPRQRLFVQPKTLLEWRI